MLSDLRILLSGKKVTDKLADYFPNLGIFHFNHARSALTFYLKFLGLRPGAVVGVQVINCITVFQAILNAGCKPCFIDIDEHFTMSLEDLKNKYHLLDALIVTHTFGNPADLKSILKLVGDLPVIEDCAHGFLTRCGDRIAGTLGNAGIFSYGLGKFPAVGDGGFLILNKASEIAGFTGYCKSLKYPGEVKSLFVLIKDILTRLMYHPVIYKALYIIKQRSGKVKSFHKRYRYDISTGYIQNQKLLKCRLHTINEALSRRLENLNFIQRNLPAGIMRISPGFNGFMCPVICSDPIHIANILAHKGIEVSAHFRDSISQAVSYGYARGQCINAESVIGHYITIPLYENYPHSCLESICQVMREQEEDIENSY